MLRTNGTRYWRNPSILTKPQTFVCIPRSPRCSAWFRKLYADFPPADARKVAAWSGAPCGSSEELPAFALEDLNPNSATFGATVSLSELLDEHLAIYWSQAT